MNTTYRFPRRRSKDTEYLTDKQIEIANIIGVKWYPTVHTTDDGEVSTECPAPEICGYFCTQEDEMRIKMIQKLHRSDSGK
jgi:hypothetical protein